MARPRVLRKNFLLKATVYPVVMLGGLVLAFYYYDVLLGKTMSWLLAAATGIALYGLARLVVPIITELWGGRP